MNEIIPSEFRSFVRNTGVRAFDRLANKVAVLDEALRKIMRSWARLSAEQKERLFDQLIATAQEPEGEPETATGIKRYNPDEVKKTLPKVKAKAKAKTKAKAKDKPKAKAKAKAATKTKTRAKAQPDT